MKLLLALSILASGSLWAQSADFKAAQLSNRDRQAILPHLINASRNLCAERYKAFDSAVKMKFTGQAVDVEKTVVAPYASDPVGLRLCLDSQASVSSYSGDSLEREAMRTVLRDAYAALEKVEAKVERENQNPVYLQYKKPYPSARGGNAAR